MGRYIKFPSVSAEPLCALALFEGTIPNPANIALIAIITKSQVRILFAGLGKDISILSLSVLREEFWKT
jgi:hypothetical protein